MREKKENKKRPKGVNKAFEYGLADFKEPLMVQIELLTQQVEALNEEGDDDEQSSRI